MTIKIQERIEGKRGCGYRKPGGIYLVGPPTGQSCCKLPLPLTVCPCCGAGIKPSRGWTWVDCEKLFGDEPCVSPLQADLCHCPLYIPSQLGMARLLWIGEKFYKTPDDFLQEANAMGISRRISTVPKGFEPGKTWVLLAHRKGVDLSILSSEPNPEPIWQPAIFSVFRPSAIEYITTGDETEEDLERLAKRGLTPVMVRNRVAYE
jgi:hypothetical protein